jgi:DNA repair protein RecO
MATLRLMVEIGLTPCLDSCVRCHDHVNVPYRFSFFEGGLLCKREEFRQTQAELTVLSPDTLALLRHIATAPHKKLFRFYASSETRSEASDFADRWLEERMEKRYNRLAFLDQNSTFLLD